MIDAILLVNAAGRLAAIFANESVFSDFEFCCSAADSADTAGGCCFVVFCMAAEFEPEATRLGKSFSTKKYKSNYIWKKF